MIKPDRKRIAAAEAKEKALYSQGLLYLPDFIQRTGR